MKYSFIILIIYTIMTKPIILIDTSYTSFYRFFATIRWFSFAHQEEFNQLKNNKDYNWKTNKIFIEKYEKMYLSSIEKLVKKKIFNNSHIIFCMDSPKSDLWRTQILPNYKGDRIDLSLKYNFKPTFEYTYNNIIPDFINSYNNIYSLRLDKIEADDIIAIICMYFKETNPSQQLYIISGDEDFHQLGRNYITFINYKDKPFVLTEEQAYKSLYNKFINGDTSDSIPSIFPKGKRIKKKEIIESQDKLNEYLENNPDAKKQFDINKKMIDFNYIPKIYYNKIIKMYNSLFSIDV